MAAELFTWRKSQATGGKTKQNILVTYNSVTSRLNVRGSEGGRLGHQVLCTVLISQLGQM